MTKGFFQKSLLGLLMLLAAAAFTFANKNRNPPESGYECWLRYTAKDHALGRYATICMDTNSKLMKSAKNELILAYNGFFNSVPDITGTISNKPTLLVGNEDFILHFLNKNKIQQHLNKLKSDDGYIMFPENRDGQDLYVICGKTDRAALYGIFHYVRNIQINQFSKDAVIVENPTNPLRMVNHWDNVASLDKPEKTVSVERGYAGNSIWKWHALPKTEKRYIDYARLLASVGLNGTAINSVNTCCGDDKNGWELLKTEYLKKLKGITVPLDKYGISVYLSVNFFSPIKIDGLPTADPLNPDVIQWWKDKAREIKQYIPNFKGFLVKADSEGQPGPKLYGRTHQEGANMLAKAVESIGGIVIWRAFVYSPEGERSERSLQAFEEYQPLDGKFNENVVLQIKNGPIDFQPNEPVSSLFGALKKTNIALELQITQEYTGQSIHLNYLIPYWKRVLDFDTYNNGKGSSVASVLQHAAINPNNFGIAGVINFGSNTNWTGHHLAQANTYGFARQCWNPKLESKTIAEEWIKMTFSDEQEVVGVLSDILLQSEEIYNKYTFPFGLGVMGWIEDETNHFRPDPYARRFYHSIEYHQTDSIGTGKDRTVETGNGYIGQYRPALREKYKNPVTCPEDQILWFHYLPYDYTMKSGKTLIQSIYDNHFEGVEQVKGMLEKFSSLKEKIDEQRYHEILARLESQISEAILWRDIINGYYYRESGIADEHGRQVELIRSIQGIWTE